MTTSTAVSIPCEKCKRPDVMQRSTVRAYPTFVVALGYVLWVPAAVVLGLMLLGVAVGILRDLSGTGMFATMGGYELGALGIGFLLMLPFIAAGTFLTRSRKVWRCQACDYIYERA